MCLYAKGSSVKTTSSFLVGGGEILVKAGRLCFSIYLPPKCILHHFKLFIFVIQALFEETSQVFVH